MSDYRWSLGTLIGLPVLILLFLICLGLGVWMLGVARRLRTSESSWDRSEYGPAMGLAGLAFASALFIAAGTAWGMWPYEGEYHQWRETGGVVEQIDSRLLADGNGGMSERFVVTFADGMQRSCDDTRCAQVEEGDRLTIACKRLWQWSGTHGYDCNYIAHAPPDQDPS